MPLATLDTTMKSINIKMTCTSVDQCGPHLADSAQADYLSAGRFPLLYSSARADYCYIVQRRQYLELSQKTEYHAIGYPGYQNENYQYQTRLYHIC
jgi:hypothetical protein